jgi:hypothetical protein
MSKKTEGTISSNPFYVKLFFHKFSKDRFLRLRPLFQGSFLVAALCIPYVYKGNHMPDIGLGFRTLAFLIKSPVDKPKIQSQKRADNPSAHIQVL